MVRGKSNFVFKHIIKFKYFKKILIQYGFIIFLPKEKEILKGFEFLQKNFKYKYKPH